MEPTLNQLEYIQNIITRLKNNSFLIMGWAITLVSALFALVVKDADTDCAFIAFRAMLIFWILGGFFRLPKEKSET